MSDPFDKSWTWHRDERLMNIYIDMLKQVKPDRWIETGTFYAQTIRWLADRYPNLEIYSTELLVSNYEAAKFFCEPFYPTIHLWHKNSPDFLREIYDKIKDDINIFYLDAHGESYLPLRDECEVISKLKKYIIIIDDFETKSPPFQGDWANLMYVSDILGKKCLVQSYEPQETCRGNGIFVKGIKYDPPSDLKEEKI